MSLQSFFGLITDPVGNARKNNPDDVIRVKDRLQSVGYIEREDEPHGYITREMDSALWKFQKEKGLKVDGFMLPGGETEKALIEARKNPNDYLEFDGKELRHLRNGVVQDKWKAVSGKTDYQNYNYQNLENKGPIPEGEWLVKQSRHQNIGDIDSWNRFRSSVGFGTWREGWRNHGVMIEFGSTR